MINSLTEIKNTQNEYKEANRNNNEFSKKELTPQNPKLLHWSFINPIQNKLIQTDPYYSYYFLCELCRHLVFDPVYCSDCKHIFCLYCIRNKEKFIINSENNILKCLHGAITDLPKEREDKLKQISIDQCFFECDERNLDLITYPEHTRKCYEIFNKNQKEITEFLRLRKEKLITMTEGDNNIFDNAMYEKLIEQQDYADFQKHNYENDKLLDPAKRLLFIQELNEKIERLQSEINVLEVQNTFMYVTCSIVMLSKRFNVIT